MTIAGINLDLDILSVVKKGIKVQETNTITATKIVNLHEMWSNSNEMEGDIVASIHTKNYKENRPKEENNLHATLT